ncbi:hypothetical protein CRG98_000945 [Punica granatum]|uniref:Uncharacterized protein n=1 Tax=Punica granatum TaxID=22663 RepID=A0A2I0LDG8_PUNGR|nr:hypothetical protein CRG98_000945 [Punica granatum]
MGPLDHHSRTSSQPFHCASRGSNRRSSVLHCHHLPLRHWLLLKKKGGEKGSRPSVSDPDPTTELHAPTENAGDHGGVVEG